MRIAVADTVLGQDSINFDPHFREFANFLDGVGLPAEWSPYFNGPDRDNVSIDEELRVSRDATASPGQRLRTRPGTPFSSWLPSAPTGNTITNNLSETSESFLARKEDHKS